MPSAVTKPTIATMSGFSWPLLLVSMLGGLMVASAIGLWAYFGTTVFFEMVRTGWVACF